jgi:acyl carrier protein
MINSEQIKDIISEVIIGFDIEKLGQDQNFFDAGIDSLDHMSILLAIEEKHDINIPDDAVEKCSSIEGIISYLKKHMNN